MSRKVLAIDKSDKTNLFKQLEKEDKARKNWRRIATQIQMVKALSPNSNLREEMAAKHTMDEEHA